MPPSPSSSQPRSLLTDCDIAHDITARAQEIERAARAVSYAAGQAEWCLWAREQDGMNQEYVERQHVEMASEIAGLLDTLIYVLEERGMLDTFTEARRGV